MKTVYQEGFKERITPKYDSETNKFVIKPFADAQFALAKAAFSKYEREEFFDTAYVQILSDYFMTWLKTEPHCTKEREFLYSCAMALGSVKSKMIEFEQYGANAAHIQSNAKPNEDTQDNE